MTIRIGRLGTRLATAAVTVLLAVGIAFLLSRVSGDPVRTMLGPSATDDQVTQVTHDLGLDRSLPVQYIAYLGGLVHGDLGTSITYNVPNYDLITERAGASAELAATALLVAIAIGLPLGVAAAVREGTVWDRVLTATSVLGQSIPTFWLGLMLILIFAVTLGWLPAGQAGSAQAVVLPAITLGLLPASQIARLTRSNLVDSLGEQYVQAARARGLSSRRVLFNYGLRNALLPVITIVGLQIGWLISGAVVVEYVFAWPGLGSLAATAVQSSDFPLVQAIVVFAAITFVVINLLVDLLYGVIDPRIRAAHR